MGWRFYRRVRILPGVHVNLSRSGPSVSVGVRGAHVTFGKRGVTRTVGLPGSGVFYTSREGWHSGAHTALPATTTAGTTSGPVSGWWIVAAIACLALVAFVLLLIGAGQI